MVKNALSVFIILVLFPFIFFIGSFNSCKNPTQPTPFDKTKFTLSIEDAAVTEVWIKLTLSEDVSSRRVVLRRDTLTLLSMRMQNTDTLILDEGLKPKTRYTYSAELYTDEGKLVHTHEPKTVLTMDTTSHNFTWRTYTFGGGDDSYLYDVSIINEDDIWAVGEISLRDSSGNIFNPPFNIAHWNGKGWELQTVRFRYTDTYYGISGASAVFAFGPNDVLVSSGASVMRWDGRIWSNLAGLYISDNNILGLADRLWGISSKDLYGVGRNGSIIHWNAGKWRKIESGTSTNINDVWGIVDPETEKEEVFCVVSDFWEPQDRKILKISEGEVDSIPWNTGRDVVSIWTNKGFPLYVCGAGIFENKNGYWNQISVGTNIYTHYIRGSGLNDIFVAGSFGFLAHFNGIGWEVLPNETSATYSAIAVKNNIVVAVGRKYTQAVIAVGSRCP